MPTKVLWVTLSLACVGGGEKSRPTTALGSGLPQGHIYPLDKLIAVMGFVLRATISRDLLVFKRTDVGKSEFDWRTQLCCS